MLQVYNIVFHNFLNIGYLSSVVQYTHADYFIPNGL